MYTNIYNIYSSCLLFWSNAALEIILPDGEGSSNFVYSYKVFYCVGSTVKQPGMSNVKYGGLFQLNLTFHCLLIALYSVWFGFSEENSEDVFVSAPQRYSLCSDRYEKCLINPIIDSLCSFEKNGIQSEYNIIIDSNELTFYTIQFHENK